VRLAAEIHAWIWTVAGPASFYEAGGTFFFAQTTDWAVPVPNEKEHSIEGITGGIAVFIDFAD
jgi:hypothetical protein